LTKTTRKSQNRKRRTLGTTDN